jgi:hypothetical protein
LRRIFISKKGEVSMRKIDKFKRGIPLLVFISYYYEDDHIKERGRGGI